MSRSFKVLIIALIALTANTAAFAQAKKSPARPASPSKSAQLKSDVAKAREDLIKATTDYKASLEKLVVMYEADLKTANDRLAQHKDLLAQGIISKREFEQNEKKIAEAQAKVSQSRKQIAEADDLIAESSVVDQPEESRPGTGRLASTSAYVRYSGLGHWALSDATKVGSFFAGKFGHALPISAYGQTATHDRMGFDHRNSVDVAVHPDSAEGQALTAYLKTAGIPFIAFRHAVSGSATGAHIHIGYPSHRISVSASAH
jgi:hypothetical protein